MIGQKILEYSLKSLRLHRMAIQINCMEQFPAIVTLQIVQLTPFHIDTSEMEKAGAISQKISFIAAWINFIKSWFCIHYF